MASFLNRINIWAAIIAHQSLLQFQHVSCGSVPTHLPSASFYSEPDMNPFLPIENLLLACCIGSIFSHMQLPQQQRQRQRRRHRPRPCRQFETQARVFDRVYSNTLTATAASRICKGHHTVAHNPTNKACMRAARRARVPPAAADTHTQFHS